jgi:tetratricopeptide (TPR) repeat protein
MHRAAIVLLLGLLAARTVSGQEPVCPSLADSTVEHGWTLYRRGAIDSAEVTFGGALERCPGHIGALVGDGYTQLRQHRLNAAAERFTAVLARAPDYVDALMGAGLVAWRRGDVDAARVAFVRALALDSNQVEAHQILAIIGLPPGRPPLVLPDTIEVRTRARGDGFEILTDGAWEPFYVNGVNLGAALPGRHPSEFPDSATYAEWIEQMGTMGANAVRVYTIHPPAFYEALERYNRLHPDRPLWLIHGVWTGLPPRHDFGDHTWNVQFTAEMHRVVDLLHGRADIPDRPGHASGFYTADVSHWTLAYIIGREWEPYAVQAYDLANPGAHDWRGRFLEVSGGTATEVWLARALDGLIGYETDRYRVQRPVAFASWPTLDPLFHQTETSIAEDRAMRGILEDDDALQHDDDVVAVDPSAIESTNGFQAGVFAAYHAYPYYPDFIVLGGGYSEYLRRLKQRHPDIPVLIAEYGVPASLGIAHLSPEGWHHGGHTEAGMAAINAKLTRLIADRGMAGGIVFAWIDEWFKQNWLVAPLELPQDRRRFWLSRMNPEQQYGVLAVEPEPRLPGATLAERVEAWQDMPPLYGGTVRALADEAYLRLFVTPPDTSGRDSILVGIDVLDPESGSFGWPGVSDSVLPVGLEFVIVATPDEVRVLADPAVNPFRVRRQAVLRDSLAWMLVGQPPPGLFQGAYDQVPRYPLGGRRHADGQFDSLRVVTNRVRLSRDGVEFAASGYDRGVLPAGAEPDGFWEWDAAHGVLEVRVPWSLLNVADPSTRRVLSSPADGETGYTTRTVESIGILLRAQAGDGTWRTWPVSGQAIDVARFTWDPWDDPRWRIRPRPLYEALQATYRTTQRTAQQR